MNSPSATARKSRVAEPASFATMTKEKRDLRVDTSDERDSAPLRRSVRGLCASVIQTLYGRALPRLRRCIAPFLLRKLHMTSFHMPKERGRRGASFRNMGQATSGCRLPTADLLISDRAHVRMPPLSRTAPPAVSIDEAAPRIRWRLPCGRTRDEACTTSCRACGLRRSDGNSRVFSLLSSSQPRSLNPPKTSFQPRVDRGQYWAESEPQGPAQEPVTFPNVCGLSVVRGAERR
jgi:hypothetical protein